MKIFSRVFFTAAALLALSLTAEAQKSFETTLETLRLQPLAITSKRFEKADFFKQFGKAFKISSAVYWSGVFADIATSRGKYEGNPLMRNFDGNISAGRAIAFAAVPYAISLWLEKTHHSKAASIIRFVHGGTRFAVAVHNQGVNKL